MAATVTTCIEEMDKTVLVSRVNSSRGQGDNNTTKGEISKVNSPNIDRKGEIEISKKYILDLFIGRI